MTTAVARQVDALQQEFSTLHFADAEFPMLTRWGVTDFSHTVHSLGCNYLAAFGRHVGHWALTEYPIRTSDDSALRTVRSDVAWWARDDEMVTLLGEFERCDPGRPGKLVSKARSLLEAHRCLPPAPRVLLLVGWKMSGASLGDLAPVRSAVVDGLQTSAGHPVAGLDQDSCFVLAIADFAEIDAAVKLMKVRVL